VINKNVPVPIFRKILVDELKIPEYRPRGNAGRIFPSG
jgi:hypothetical protein